MSRNHPRMTADHSRSSDREESGSLLHTHWPAAFFCLLLIFGFSFGLYLGVEKSKVPTKVTKEVAQNDKPSSPKTETVPETNVKETPRVEPKPEKKVVEPKKKEAVAAVDPKPKNKPEAAPEPKPTPEPKPEPKKTIPVEPKPIPKKVEAVAFMDKIRPIFRDKCTVCHGDPKVKGGLNLLTLAAINKGGDSGAGIDPGNLAGSLIWTKIDDQSMPPSGSKQLTPDEIKLIKAWIEAGGK